MARRGFGGSRGIVRGVPRRRDSPGAGHRVAKFIAGDDEEDDGAAEEATRGAGVLDDDEDFDGSYAAIIEDGPGTPPRAWRGGGAGTTVANGSRLDADAVAPESSTRRERESESEPNPEPRGAFARRWARKMGAVLVAVAEMPATAVLRVTMPELGADPARQSRALVSLLPVTAPLFFATAERIFPGTLTPAGLAYGAVCGAIGAAATWCAWPTLTGPEAPRASVRIMDAVLTAVAFVISVAWLDAVSGELVALVAAVAKIRGVSDAVVRATASVWARGAAAATVNVIVAKQGRPAMAVAACFAQPAFHLAGAVGTGFLARALTARGARRRNPSRAPGRDGRRVRGARRVLSVRRLRRAARARLEGQSTRRRRYARVLRALRRGARARRRGRRHGEKFRAMTSEVRTDGRDVASFGLLRASERPSFHRNIFSSTARETMRFSCTLVTNHPFFTVLLHSRRRARPSFRAALSYGALVCDRLVGFTRAARCLARSVRTRNAGRAPRRLPPPWRVARPGITCASVACAD